MNLRMASVPRGRRKLASVVRAAGDIVTIDDVVAVLSVERAEASKLLSRWAGQAWLRRVGPGTYAVAPLDSLESEHVLDDPWKLVPVLYAPAYIGGWSAAEHWDLTEQLFHSTLVMTARTVRKKRRTHHGAPFVLCHVQKQKLFGTQTVWRGRSKVLVSDAHRTMIDMLDKPSLGGGCQHIIDCWAAYLERDDRDDNLLVRYARTLGHGAVFKRLGYLAERRPDAQALAKACRRHMTAGNAKLDPALECSRLVSRWRLWVPRNQAGLMP